MTNPIENKKYFGHEKAQNLLLSITESNKIPHAFLFSGAKGIGKFTLACHFVKFLFSQNETDLQDEVVDLFGDSTPKKKSLITNKNTNSIDLILKNSHPDLKIIEPLKGKTEIAVDEVRDVIHFINHTPAMAKYRVVIINSADDLNKNSANALLKVLEEPTKNSILILISHNPGFLLSTIKSRCRVIKFDNLKNDEFDNVMAESGYKSKDKADISTARAIANNSPGVASQIIENNGETILKRINEILSQIQNPEISKIIKFSDLIKGKENNDNWFVFSEILLWQFSRFIKHLSFPSNENFNDEETIFINYLKSKNQTTEVLTNKYYEMVEIINKAESVNMDKVDSLKKIIYEILK
jgi:DNA polymerase-3 subunit delta'